MLAVGELQKEIGPYQRITAAAGILDENIETPVPDGYAHPHWLGVWNSWDEWLNAPGVRATDGKGRESAFRRWLVSSPNPAAMGAMTADATAGQNLVQLVGAGTLGPSADAALRVAAPEIPLKNGAIAWWVSGENQKARVSGSAEPLDKADQLGQRSTWPGSGHRHLDGLGDLPASGDALAKSISLPTLGVAAESPEVRERLQGHFHDLTTDSVGLLSNVRSGGLKKDLNLLLERTRLPQEFGDFSRSRQGGSIVSIRDKATQIPAAVHGQQNPNFSSWYKLHQYYSLYKRQGAESAQDSIPLPFRRGVWGNNSPNANFHWDRGNFDQLGLARTPILSRLMMVFSTRRVPSRTPGKYAFEPDRDPAVQGIFVRNWTVSPERIRQDDRSAVVWAGSAMKDRELVASGQSSHSHSLAYQVVVCRRSIFFNGLHRKKQIPAFNVFTAKALLAETHDAWERLYVKNEG